MRLVTYDSGGGPRAGALRDGTVIDLWRELGREPPEGSPPSVRALLAHGLLDEAARVVSDAAGLSPSDVCLRPPVPDPQKLVGIGLNYRSHAEEAASDPPASPTFFAKFPNALAAPGAEVALPGTSEKVDYGAEVAFVVERRARGVGEAEALDHLAVPIRPGWCRSFRRACSARRWAGSSSSPTRRRSARRWVLGPRSSLPPTSS